MITETELQVDSSAEQKKQLFKTKLIAIAQSGGQKILWDYSSLLAKGVGATHIQMAFITAIQNLGSALLQGIFGRLSDNFGRKIVLFMGFIVATVSTIVLSFISSPILFMVIIACYSIALSMIVPSWMALLGDISTEKTRTHLIGTLSMIGTIFSSIIMLILGFVTDYLPWDTVRKYRSMIFIGAFFFAIAALIILRFRETNSVKEKTERTSILVLFQDRKFVIFIAATMPWWFVMSFLWPISPTVIFNLHPNNLQVAILSISFSAGIIGGQWFSAQYADRIGRRFTIFIGFVALCIVPIVFAFAYAWYIIIIANIFGGLGNGFAFVSLNSEILNMAKPKIKGTYTGTYNLLSGILTFIGSFVSGVIFEALEPKFELNLLLSVYLTSIAVARILMTIPVLILSVKEKNHQQSD
ncbi:MAG: MFS transporter [Candidatus Thorarchaeota archaeon]